MASPTESRPIDPGTRIGHVHLKVANLDRALAFYCGVLGFELMQRYGSEAAFISAGGYHHHIGMNTWAGVGVPVPPEGAARLLSYELRLPTTAALDAVRDRVRAADIPLTEQAQGWAVRDPSHNLVLLCLSA